MCPKIDVSALGVYVDDLIKGTPEEKRQIRDRVISTINAHNRTLKLIYRWCAGMPPAAPA